MLFRRIFKRLENQYRLAVKFGVVSALDDLINGVRVWSFRPVNKINLGNGSSVSETNDYLNIVDAAVNIPYAFKKFKSCRQYREILEHVNRDQGNSYAEIIKAYGSASKELTSFIPTDLGKPFRYSYKGFGRVSPTSLRYGKIALDIQAIFGSTKDFSIAEIGIGYGGQSSAIFRQSGFSQYTYFDLPKVLSLTKKYINLTDPALPLSTGDLTMASNTQYDLVISNYAYSELNIEVQESYFRKVILKSKRGYIIFNSLGHESFNSESAIVFAAKIRDSTMLKEFPLTHKNNVLVVWGHSNLDSIIQP